MIYYSVSVPSYAGHDLRRCCVVTERGRLLIVLASQEPQTAVELAQRAGQDPVAVLRHLQRLVTQGFVLVDTGDALALYRLRPRQAPLTPETAPGRILVVEDDVILRDLVVEVLEEENYAVLAAETLAAAQELLALAEFGLVIADGFSPTPDAVLVNSADFLRAAGVTPVVLFTAHRVDLDAARAAGFRSVWTKPFELDALVVQVRDLLLP
jgi:CheY-like chemotaxis protein